MFPHCSPDISSYKLGEFYPHDLMTFVFDQVVILQWRIEMLMSLLRPKNLKVV